MSAEKTYRNDIQGLRALAVVPVVLYHVDGALVPGGFVGVDIFFVISGYLITQILLRELENGTFSILGFYERRVKRLFPALYAMLAAVLVFGAFVLSPADFEQLGRTALATVFFCSNAMFLSLSSYFDGAAEIKPLLHTWSLAVEEQFYLAFPLVLAGIMRFAPKALKPLLWAGALLSFALCVFVSRNHQAAAFYLPVTRAFELLVGCILAAGAVPVLRNARALDTVSILGLALIGASFFAIDKTAVFPGWRALVPAAGCALVIYAGQGRTSLAGALLSRKPLVAIGAISYSLYLWHWPVLVFARYTTSGEPGLARQIIAVTIAVLLATASWRWLEQPVGRSRASRKRVLAWGGGAMVAGALASGVLIAGGGLPARLSPSALAMFAGAQDSSPHRQLCHGNGWQAVPYEKNCIFGSKDTPPDVAVWGDSFGAELAVALGEAEGVKGRSILQITASSCPPAMGYAIGYRPNCMGLNVETLASLAADNRIGTVLLVANYTRYGKDVAGLMAGIARSADVLATAGKKLVLVYPVPRMPSDAPRTLGVRVSQGKTVEPFGMPLDDYASQNAVVLEALDGLALRHGATKLRTDEILCADGLCPAYRAGAGVLYYDAEHLSLAGARLVVEGISRARTASQK